MVFGAANVSKEEIAGKTVLDVGSHDYNGNFHSLFKHYNPKKFVGTDMTPGKGVDVVCMAEDTVKIFGKESFDVVISSELMEHARNWREIIHNIKQVCAPGGLIVITTRSFGFGLHSYPHDYWRYEYEDMKEIFSDCEILVLEKDRQAPGIFIKARKPLNFKENDISKIALYSMIQKKRIIDIDPQAEKDFLAQCKRRDLALRMVKSVEGFFFGIGHKLLFR